MTEPVQLNENEAKEQILAKAKQLHDSLTQLHENQKAAESALSDKNYLDQPNSALMVAYEAIYDSIHQMQKSAADLRGMMSSFLSFEDMLNKGMADIHYDTKTADQLKHMSLKDISEMQAENMTLQNESSTYSNIEQTGQQQQQIDLSSLNSLLQSIEQATQKTSFLSNVLSNLTNQIGSISRG